MVKIAFPFALLLMSWTQVPAVEILRTGNIARQLTEQDVRALERILPSDAKPWLLDGDPGQIASSQNISAYLPPATTTAVLRRGSVITVTRRAFSSPTDWTVLLAGTYAQVAITGRKFDEIRGDDDINRPFLVSGNFDDNELIQIVTIIRSNPNPGGTVLTAIEPLPIRSVAWQGSNSVIVTTRRAVMQGQSIILQRMGQNWTVASVRFWIA